MRNLLWLFLILIFSETAPSQCFPSLQDLPVCPPPDGAPPYIESNGPDGHKCDLYTDTNSELLQLCNGKKYRGVGPAGNSVNWKFCIRLDIQGAYDFKYKIKIYKAPFNSNVSDWDSYSLVSESGEKEIDNASVNHQSDLFQTNVSYGYTYRAKIGYKIRSGNSNIWPFSWKEIESNTWNTYNCLPQPNFTINGQTANEVQVNLSDAFLMNFQNAISCNQYYVVSVQQSDPYWNKFGPENIKSLHQSELPFYGGISGFNLKAFNASFGAFNFQPGKFYRIRLAVGPPWTERTVLLKINPCTPVVNCTLNNQAAYQVTAYKKDPLLLNFSSTLSCTGDYFLSVQPSDATGSGAGPEKALWFSETTLSQYGGKGAFNLKQFYSSFGAFTFEEGNYYRIKLALSEPWTERVVLLYIQPCTPVVIFTLNGATESPVPLPVNSAFTLNFSNTLSCTGDYFISVLPSDASWNSLGPENGRWLSESGINPFGGKNAFDLKAFNDSFNTFDFEDGKYYRIKVAVSEPWTEYVMLLLVQNSIINTKTKNKK